MNITPEIIEEIKFRNSIESVISSYITLKRAGSNFNANCPFHSEKTPSFTVFPATQSFYCFGCGAGGDAISFVMRMENLDYLTAIRTLAERSGIKLPEEQVRPDGKKEVGRQRVLEMNKAALEFFKKALYDERIGKEAREYLLNKRKLSPALIKHFQLGFAPNSFGALHDHLKKLGYTDEEMIVAFLCGKSSKTGNAFDYFRNRVIFPIIDVTGNVVAFGGRVLDDSTPKYLNTSDTPAFKKSKNLFALNFAKNHCEKMLILCEGYMDVIALHAAGFENSVATLGTAITSEQARIFSRYTKKVIISYDSDAAGQKAADKAFNLLQEVGIDVKVIKMEGAKDPDEYIKKNGASKFASLLEASKTRFEFECDRVFAKYDISIINEKIKASRELCSFIAACSSDVERELYSRRLSKLLDVPADSIISDVNGIIRKARAGSKKNEVSELYRKSSGIGDRINPESASHVKANKTEEAILGLMMLKEEHLRLCVDKLTVDSFVTPFNRKVFEKISEIYNQYKKFDLGLLSGDFTLDEISRITKMQSDRGRLTVNDEKVLNGYIDTLVQEKQKGVDSDTFDSILEAIKNKKK